MPLSYFHLRCFFVFTVITRLGSGNEDVKFFTGSDGMDEIRYEYVRETVQVEQFGNKIREKRLRWSDMCRGGIADIVYKGC